MQLSLAVSPQTQTASEALTVLFGRKGRDLAAGFEDVGALFEAKIEDPALAEMLRAVKTLAAAMTEAPLKKRDALNSGRAVIEYLRVRMARATREQARVLYLDKKNCLIADEVSHGTVDHVAIYPREVVRRALELDASAVILAHNHPSGDPAPSAADVEMTKAIKAALATVDIAVHDHIIIGASGEASLRSLGLM